MFIFFFFNDTATTEIYTLSLHDALPICASVTKDYVVVDAATGAVATSWDIIMNYTPVDPGYPGGDRKSTRLNSSHLVISYAVFCLKKKKKEHKYTSIFSCSVMQFDRMTA